MVNAQKKRKIIIYTPAKILPLLMLLLQFPLLKSECNIDQPILKNENCELTYCSKEEFSSGACTISNDIIKTQWINNIREFKDYDRLRYNNLAVNSKGDLVLEISTQESNYKGIRYFYGLKKDGSYLFKDENNESVPTKIIIVKDGDSQILRHESVTIFISLKNDDNDDKQYLLSIGSNKDAVVELYDLENGSVSYVNTFDFTGHKIFSTSSTIMELKDGDTNLKEYLYIFSGQDAGDIASGSNFRYLLQKYSFNKNVISFNDGYEVSQAKKNGYCSRPLSCFQTDSNIIGSYYMTGPKEYVIRLYDMNLVEKKSYIFEKLPKIVASTGIFYYSVLLKDNILALIYYSNIDNTFPRLSIKKVNNDYTITNKMNFTLDYGYEFNNVPLYNSLIKIGDYRFLYLTTSINREQLYFLLFDLYNNANNIKIRIFKSNIFSLYNYKIYKEIKTILYNGYLAFSASVCTNDVCSITDSNENYFSIFLIFGYVNGEDSTIDISKCLSENIDSNDVTEDNNLILKLQKLGKIDNNIFGYEFSNQIKLITIPNELEFYNKLSSGQKTLVNSGDILELSHEIVQKSGITKNGQTAFLEYQLIINKPSLQNLNQYTIAIEDYPVNPTVEEDYVNENNKFYSKTVKSEFKLCYESCSSCNYLGTSPSNQKCLTCIQEDYSLQFTGNCVPEGHYLDIELDEIKRCGEDAKIIVNKNTGKKYCFKKDYNCPDDYPFYLEKSHECIENYSFELLLDEIMHMNVTNKNVLIYDLITEKAIQNYTMNGRMIIEGDNNYVYELTNTFNDNSDSSDNDLSTIDLGECENILKRENEIDPNIPLIILKLEKTGEVASKRNIQFEVYHPITKEKLDISVCDQIDIYIPVNLDQKTLDLYLDLQNYGYDLFNPNDSFYQDVCAHYTTENGTDVLLSDRKQYFFNDTETSCQKGCEYSKYNLEKKQVKCECNVIPENNIEPEKENKFSGKMLYEGFYDVLKYSNLRILKCYKLVFSFEGENGNYGSILMVSLFAIYIIIDSIFFFNGIYKLKILIGKILFKDKSKIEKISINNKESTKKNENNKKEKKVHKHKEKFKIIKYNKKSEAQAQPPRKSTKNAKLNNNNSLITSERKVDDKIEEKDDEVFNHTFTKNKYKLGSKTELIYIEKNKGKPKRKQSDKNININKISKKNFGKIFSSSNKKDKEKLDNISGSISDNLSRNESENFDKKENIDIISCEDSQGNDLNFGDIEIHRKADKSERKAKKQKMYDSASYYNDLISANRLSRVSSLNNSINNFMSMNNSIYNTDSKSINEESNKKVTLKKKKSKFLSKEEKEKKKRKGKEENKIVSHCCIKGNNFKDFELNELEYNEAVVQDNRGFFQYYWQLVRREHLFIFIFFVYDDFNIFSIKLSLFVFSLALDFGLNVFFFFDESMNKIYLDYGKYSFLAQIPQILYSSLLSQGIDILIRYLCLTEKDMYQIKVYSEKKNKEYYKKEIFKTFTYIKFKLICYFIISFIMMVFFWYLISAFCAVYKNTQIILFEDILYSFLLDLIYPFGLYLFPSSLRILSLKDKKKRLKIIYFFSNIIPFI